MAYTILNPDGTTLVTLADRSIDQTTTSLTLVGKNYSGYGEHWNNNLIKLLSNDASSNSSPPRNPLKGQLWYDTTSQRLKVYDQEFKNVGGAIIAGAEPSNLISGDVWFDISNEQLKVVANNNVYTVGPIFPKFVGENGWALPTYILKDLDNVSKDVTLMKNFGETLGFVSGSNFYISTGTQFNYITTATTSSVRGLNLLGDIQITGRTIIASNVPATSNATGEVGEIAWDSGYIYICYMKDKWRRVALSASSW